MLNWLKRFFKAGKAEKEHEEQFQYIPEDKDKQKELESLDAISERKKMAGRNDPCPCGSGKKFKYCHGIENSIEFFQKRLLEDFQVRYEDTGGGKSSSSI